MSQVWEHQRRKFTALPDAEVARRLARRRARLAAVVEEIEKFWDEHERGPTRAELAERVGIGIDQLRKYLNELRVLNRVTWDDQANHSLRVR